MWSGKFGCLLQLPFGDRTLWSQAGRELAWRAPLPPSLGGSSIRWFKRLRGLDSSLPGYGTFCQGTWCPLGVPASGTMSLVGKAAPGLLCIPFSIFSKGYIRAFQMLPLAVQFQCGCLGVSVPLQGVFLLGGCFLFPCCRACWLGFFWLWFPYPSVFFVTALGRPYGQE